MTVMVTRSGQVASKARPDAVAELARRLCNVPVGQRIPTVQELQAHLGVGSGTVVKALRTLQADGAVVLEPHGHLGTLLVGRDLGALWDFARLGNMRVLLTPPGPMEQHAVAAAVRQAMADNDIPVVIDFVPGARRRIKEVSAGRAHATVTSLGALRQHERESSDLHRLDLGEHTYYDRGSLVVVQRGGRAGMSPRRVGIDVTSDDHTALTDLEFGPSAQRVNCSFVEGPAGVLQGRFDAVVWHRMPAIIPPELAGLVVRPLGVSDDDAQLGQISRAVIVTRRADDAITGLLESVTPARVRHHIRRLGAVVGGSLLPHEALWLS